MFDLCSLVLLVGLVQNLAAGSFAIPVLVVSVHSQFNIIFSCVSNVKTSFLPFLVLGSSPLYPQITFRSPLWLFLARLLFLCLCVRKYIYPEPQELLLTQPEDIGLACPGAAY